MLRKCLFQAQHIEENLHRISLNKDEMRENNLIREFSLQVHHERFFISANGYFHIDLNLLGSVCVLWMMKTVRNIKLELISFQILATSTTYLVILIQFEHSNKEIQIKPMANTTSF